MSPELCGFDSKEPNLYKAELYATSESGGGESESQEAGGRVRPDRTTTILKPGQTGLNPSSVHGRWKHQQDQRV